MSDKTLGSFESNVPVYYGQDDDFQGSVKVYDKVVQRDDFKKGNEEERISRLAELSNGSFNGAYDFKDGKPTEGTTPTDVELALRSGTLDKADVDVISKQLEKDAKDEQEASAKKAKEDALEKVNQERQDFLDVATGFKTEDTAE